MRFSLPAYAKINLTLEVLGRRDDGYHEIMTVLQTIDLWDSLTFESGTPIELSCDDISLESADNLILKAAHLLKEETGYDSGAYIFLTKKIPTAAGLGSGATDAATTLVGLNRLWNLNLPIERLQDLAARIGSDVAFFLYGGTALAKGRGELITKLPSLPETWLVLATPTTERLPNKTAQLYSRLDKSHFTNGRYTDKLIESIIRKQHIGNDLLYNIFEHVAFDFFDQIKIQRSKLEKEEAKRIHLAGSGPALFILVSNRQHGENIRKNLEDSNVQTYLIHTLESSPFDFLKDESC